MSSAEDLSSASDEAQKPTGDILLLTDDDMARQLAPRLDKNRLIQTENTHDLLSELSKRDCSAVVLTAPREELETLVQAIRRLNNRTRVLALCRPEEHDRVREATEGLVDDCCVYPPTRGELNLLLRGLKGGEQTVERPTVLSSESLCKLISATHSLDALQSQIAEIVSSRLSVPLEWVEPHACGGGIEPLLILPGSPARVLIPKQPVRHDDSLDALIGDLHQCIPSLLGVVQRFESLHRLAITDHLTGAYNRRYFYHLVDHVLSRAAEEGFRAALLLYDIDDFKRYNDQYGHATGDEILRDTATVIQQITRDQDIVARIGGDEFAVLFWDRELRSPESQPLKDAWDLADRFRQVVATLQFSSLGPQRSGQLTISGGLASYPDHGRSCLELLQQADRALRTAKESGKNSIHLVGQSSNAD